MASTATVVPEDFPPFTGEDNIFPSPTDFSTYFVDSNSARISLLVGFVFPPMDASLFGTTQEPFPKET